MRDFLERTFGAFFAEELFFFKLFAGSNLARPVAVLLIISVLVFGIAKFLGFF